METEPGNPDFKEIMRSCETCRYRLMQRAPPPSIQRVMVCRRFPPVAIAIQTPDGMGSMSAFPLVTAETWCYEWTADEAANKMNG